MIRRRLRRHQPEKLPQGKRIGRAPGNSAFGIQAFEVADQQQTEVAPWRQARTNDVISLESLTERLDVVVKVRSVQNVIQSRVERMCGGT